MRSRTRLFLLATLVVASICVSASSVVLSQSGSRTSMTAEEWREDLAFMVGTIEKVHPNPFKVTSRAEFINKVDRLNQEIPDLPDETIIVRMMEIVALLRDGHTSLVPIDPNGFNYWYPIRFYWFSDGIFVTAVTPKYEELLGAQILKIGNLSAGDAALKSASISGQENEFNSKENIHYLSNAAALYSLGVSDKKEQITLTYKGKDGRAMNKTITAVKTVFKSESWTGWGEMFSPPGTETITSFKRLSASEFRTGRNDLPLHLRERLPYWYALLDENKTLYMQFNFVQNWGDVSFEEFYRRMFAKADELAVERFILDIRYNGGGDGSMLLPFVHEIIKRDYLNQSGRIFTIVGRKTFSAGVMLARMMDVHTNNMFVGEPMGAAFNHFGDAGSIELPNSELQLNVSTIYHQLSSSADQQQYESIHIPAVFSSVSYFSGRDVALESIRTSIGNKSIAELFLSLDNGDAALAEYEKRRRLFQEVDWWRPFSEAEMNLTGYRLLEKNRVEDSIKAFELNAKHFPNSWNVWDSLAEAYLTNGQKKKALEHYRRSLELNPLNSNAANFISDLVKEL